MGYPEPFPLIVFIALFIIPKAIGMFLYRLIISILTRVISDGNMIKGINILPCEAFNKFQEFFSKMCN